MHRSYRLAMAMILCLSILIIGSPGLAEAEGTAAVSLEQAIQIVKENFEIPAQLTEFRSSYEDERNSSVWFLEWYTDEEPGGQFEAQVDAQSGQVISMNIWEDKYENESTWQPPAISRSEAEAKATLLVKRLLPGLLSELQLSADDGRIKPLSIGGSSTYSIRWQRVHKGILFPKNGVEVEVLRDTGVISAYELNWAKSALPSSAGTISPEKAREIFSSSDMLKLEYFIPSSEDLEKAGEKRPVMLIYQVSHPSGGVIDAFTGKPLTSSSGGQSYYDEEYSLGGSSEVSIKAPADFSFSQEELSEVENTSKLMSREEAINAVKKWFELPVGIELRRGTLASEEEYGKRWVWRLSWRSAGNKAKESLNVNAMVDASTGELLSYSAYRRSLISDTDAVTGIIDRLGAQAIAETFLQKIQAQRFMQARLDESQLPEKSLKVAEYAKNPSTQAFYYSRLVNGVPVLDNGIVVVVDTVNKCITQYSLNWQDDSFPSLTGIMDESQAVELYLKALPLTLCYKNEPRDEKGEVSIRLVYQPLARERGSSFAFLDAKTGQPLDWDGQQVTQQKAVYFNDIAGSFAASEITTLGKAGLFREYGESFHPNENITVVCLLKNMLQAIDSSDATALTDEQIIKRTRNRGWIKEDIAPEGTINRADLARLMIRLLRQDLSAHAQGVYQVPYSDKENFPEGSLGYIALSTGLGIMQGDGATFKADHVVTRAEAAAVLVHTLNVQSKN